MRRVAHFLLAELAIWFLPPLLFLYAYVVRFHQDAAAIPEHLYLVGLVGAAALLAKTCLHRLLPARLADAAASVLYVSLLALMASYYALVLIGLNSWGRVITEELITSYAGQARMLCEAIGVSFGGALAGLVLGYAVALTLFHVLARRYHPVPPAPRLPVGPRWIDALLCCALLLAIAQARMFLSTSGEGSTEPMRLTLYAGKPSPFRKVEHRVIFNRRYDEQEDAARRNYRLATAVQKSNVVLIVVDALRPDHMGVYGYERDTTPHLSAWLAQGRLQKVDNVHSACAESACGLTALATSKYLYQFPDQPLTLQQMLRMYGYQVNMILGGDHTNFYNLKDVYGSVDSFYDGSMAKGRYMNDDQLVLERVATLTPWDGRPTMFQFHLMSAHALGKHEPGYARYQPSASYAGKTEGGPRQEYANFYDNGVFQADAVIHALLQQLGAKHYLDDALIVITADHGEGLGEHLLLAHGNSVREELVRVPLLLARVGGAAALALPEHAAASQIDIAPTILHQLHIPAPASWHGQPIQTSASQGLRAELAYFEMGPDAGVFDNRAAGRHYKYWNNAYTDEEFAFELGADPKERANIVWQVPAALHKEWRAAVDASRARAENVGASVK